jgi:hypothetical protein
MTARTFSVSVAAAPPPPSTTALFADSFNYSVAQNPATLPQNNNAFVNTGGWSYSKAVNLTGSSVGYIYTEFNAARGKQVAAFEIPNDGSNQSDYYLGKNVNLPANCWIKMRLLGTPGSNFSSHVSQPEQRRNKFLYPSPTGSWPVNISTERWMCGISRQTAWGLTYGLPGAPEDGSFMLTCAAATRANYPPQSGNEEEMGHNLSNHTWFTGNEWHDILMHIDISGSQGIYEMWGKRATESVWIKHANWVGGVTPSGFTWPIPVEMHADQVGIRIPTTWGNGTGLAPQCKLLMDEFAIYASDPR